MKEILRSVGHYEFFIRLVFFARFLEKFGLTKDALMRFFIVFFTRAIYSYGSTDSIS